MDEALARKDLKKRRRLAIEELLNAYKAELYEVLKQLGDLSSQAETPSVQQIIETRKNLISARYSEFLDSRFEEESLTESDRDEMQKLGVPVLCSRRVDSKSGLLTFEEADAFLTKETQEAAGVARLEPHLSKSPAFATDTRSKIKRERDKHSQRTVLSHEEPGWKRLEEFGCAACYRLMDKEDFIMRLVSHSGTYSIRQSSFTIGRSSNSTADLSQANAMAGGVTSLGRTVCKERKSNDYCKDRISKEIDVNLGMERVSDVRDGQTYARVWVKPEGVVCIKCVAAQDILVDGKPVGYGESTVLHHWSLIEIDKVFLLLLINRNAIDRVTRRATGEINL